MKKLIFAAVAAGALGLTPSVLLGGQAPQDGDEAPSFSTDDIKKSEAPPPPAVVARADAEGAKVAGQIAWRRSFDEAKRTARGRQLIVVDVYTDWCGYCKQMDKRVYADGSVVSFASSHLFVKLNAEDGAEGQRFAQAAGVRGFPTTLVFSSDGRLITAKAGAFRRPEEFLAWIREASQGS